MKTIFHIFIVFAAAEMFPVAAAEDVIEVARGHFQKNVRPDYDTTLAVLRAAADMDDVDALRELAELYSNGIGEPRSEHDKPISLLRRAAAKEDQWAEPELEMRLRLGVGTQIDLLEAAAYYLRIKSRKLRTPMMPFRAAGGVIIKPNVRIMMDVSRQSDLRHDPNREAVERLDALFEKALMQQDTAALVELAKLHETGTHGKANLPRAYAMLIMAGAPESAAKAKTLSPEDAKALERDLKWMRSVSGR
jgi:TPR repeat protein